MLRCLDSALPACALRWSLYASSFLSLLLQLCSRVRRLKGAGLVQTDLKTKTLWAINFSMDPTYLKALRDAKALVDEGIFSQEVHARNFCFS